MEEGLNTKIEGKGMKGRAWSRNGKKEEKKEGKERERERSKSDRKGDICR